MILLLCPCASLRSCACLLPWLHPRQGGGSWEWVLVVENEIGTWQGEQEWMWEWRCWRREVRKLKNKQTRKMTRMRGTQVTRPDGQKRSRGWFPVWDFQTNFKVRLPCQDVESWSDRSLSFRAVGYVLLSLSFSSWIPCPSLPCATVTCDCSGVTGPLCGCEQIWQKNKLDKHKVVFCWGELCFFCCRRVQSVP